MAWLTRTCGAPSCRALAERGARYCADHKDYESQRATVLKEKRWWSKWYKTAQWGNLRKLILHRDPICMWIENGEHCTKPSTIADHKLPHRGDRALWADLNNLQGLCAHHHGIKTAREDGGYGNYKEKENVIHAITAPVEADR